MANFELSVNYEEVGQLLRSEDLKQFCESVARDIKERAGDGYSTDTYNAGNRFICSVFTETKEAMQDNLENNTLLKALG